MTGTAYVQMDRVAWLPLAAAVPVGLLACALLVINNLRDIPTDAATGQADARRRPRRSADQGAVHGLYRWSRSALPRRSRRCGRSTLLALAALPLALAPVRLVRDGAIGPRLIAALGQTGRLQLAFGALLTVGLAIRF